MTVPPAEQRQGGAQSSLTTARKDAAERAPFGRAPLLLTALLLVVDMMLVTVFAATGNSTHRSGLDLVSILSTAWPFLVGLVVMSVLCRFWRRPDRLWPDGVLIVLGTVAVGMVLRAASGSGGVQLSFVLVTLGVLSVMLLGRRALTPRVRK